MKALAGLLLAFSLSAGIGSQAEARQCTSAKHVSKHSAKHSGKLAVHSSKKSKMKGCVCRVEPRKTKHIGSSHMMKSSTYGGYKPIKSTNMNTMEATDTMFNGKRSFDNNIQNQDLNKTNQNLNNSIQVIPQTDSLNNGSMDDYMDHGK